MVSGQPLEAQGPGGARYTVAVRSAQKPFPMRGTKHHLAATERGAPAHASPHLAQSPETHCPSRAIPSNRPPQRAAPIPVRACTPQLSPHANGTRRQTNHARRAVSLSLSHTRTHAPQPCCWQLDCRRRRRGVLTSRSRTLTRTHSLTRAPPSRPRTLQTGAGRARGTPHAHAYTRGRE